MRAASPPRSRRTHRGLKPRCAAPLLLFAAWLGGCTAADPLTPPLAPPAPPAPPQTRLQTRSAPEEEMKELD